MEIKCIFNAIYINVIERVYGLIGDKIENIYMEASEEEWVNPNNH